MIQPHTQGCRPCNAPFKTLQSSSLYSCEPQQLHKIAQSAQTFTLAQSGPVPSGFLTTLIPRLQGSAALSGNLSPTLGSVVFENICPMPLPLGPAPRSHRARQGWHCPSFCSSRSYADPGGLPKGPYTEGLEEGVGSPTVCPEWDSERVPRLAWDFSHS